MPTGQGDNTEARAGKVRLHQPASGADMNLAILTDAPLAVQIHVAASLPALILGPVAIWRRQRDALHRFAGRAWVLAMVVLAGSSFWINEARHLGPFSVIHLLSGLTFVGLWQGMAAIRAGDVQGHQRAMRGLYLQALILAGVFTFLPGRRKNAVFFGGESVAGFVAVACLGAVGLWLIWCDGRGPGAQKMR
ncbi:MAG: DUF2306 domain-containing protein [Rhodobacteraceae bacterium]|nr:DUF2306 domain-containing protein [Paracoccaceae bacterium]